MRPRVALVHSNYSVLKPYYIDSKNISAVGWGKGAGKRLLLEI